jgi:hypothetical protein
LNGIRKIPESEGNKILPSSGMKRKEMNRLLRERQL